MNKLITFWIIFVLAVFGTSTIANAAGPPKLDPVPVTVTTEYQFAGYSTATTTGDAGGYAGMNAICQQDFGGGARMCTTKEWFNTHGTRQPLLQPDRAAWVQPEFVAVVYNTLTQAIIYTDWTGTTYSTSGSTPIGLATCNQWTSEQPSHSGTMVSNEPITNRDIVRTQVCTVELQVTCCTPAQVTADR